MYRKVVLWQIKSTEKAYLFRTLPLADKLGKEIWIPISQIKHISREGQLAGGGGEVKCIVEVAEWLADKHDL